MSSNSDVQNSPNPNEQKVSSHCTAQNGGHPPLEKVTPQSFGLQTIGESPVLHRLWEDSIREAVGRHGYKNYLKALDGGRMPTQAEAALAWKDVRSVFSSKAIEAGVLSKGQNIHHWNFSKGEFPLQVIDPKNLVITPSRDMYQAIHRATSSGNL